MNLNNLRNLSANVNKELAERRLSEFIKIFWGAVDPAEYIHNWHIDVISEHLEAVFYGQIRKLLINIPPRCQKSLTVTVFFPAWVWVKRPELQWIFASYAHSLSVRDSVKCRTLIQSAQYQSFFADRYKLTDDQNTKVNFRNDKGGARIATSVGGSNTGEGGDIICYDDPNNMNEIMSEAKRGGVNSWHDTVMSTRLNNPKTGCRIIVQQRGHEKDMSGHVLSQELGWEHLCLPMRYEKKIISIPLDIEIPEYNILVENRFDEKYLKQLETELGEYGTAGQLQQRPAPAGGGMIKEKWFRYYDTLPNEFDKIIISWDTAKKVSELNDYSVGMVFGIKGKFAYLINILRKKMEYPELKSVVKVLSDEYNATLNLIEDKASGTSLIQDVRRDIRVKPILPMADKVTRMFTEVAQIEAGFVLFPEKAHWLSDFLTELLKFPAGEHDDQVDALSQFLFYFRTGKKYIMPDKYQRRR